MANSTGNKGVALVNEVRRLAGSDYKKAVPFLNSTNLAEVGNQILHFQPIYNEFINVFFNKVTMEIFDSRRYSNPFNVLTKGGSPLGGVVQNTHVNPAQAMAYDVNATSRLLQNYRPDVAVEYYGINRKDVFAVTRARQELELAFTNYDNLERFFTELIDSLYNGNEIREYNLYKALMVSAFIDEKIRKVPIARPKDTATALAFLSSLQGYSLAFSYPSSNYNKFQEVAADAGYAASPRITWTKPEDQVIIMDSRLAPIIGLNVKASAFNLQYTEMEGRILYVDDFAATGLYAIIADKNWLQVRDSKREFRDFENGSTLTLNSFLHVWGYYNVCTWANAIAFYDPDETPLVITINNGEKIQLNVDSVVEVPYTVTYNGTEVKDVNLDFIFSTNNFSMKYLKNKDVIAIASNKYSLSGIYTVLVTASAMIDNIPVSNAISMSLEII